MGIPMCLIAFAWNPGTPRPLVLAANRDEFHARPTRALHWWDWPEGPLAGRDEQAGGTWLAARRDGRFAALTNYRDPKAASGERSRGELPLRWLDARIGARMFGEDVRRQVAKHGPFNLLYGDMKQLWIVGSHSEAAPVPPGTHALSNGAFDRPWPKTIRAVRRMQQWMEDDGEDVDALLDLLDDRSPAAAAELPDTGVGIELERLLSAPFIVSPRYGTRCASALILDDHARFAERQFDAGGSGIGERIFQWRTG